MMTDRGGGTKKDESMPEAFVLATALMPVAMAQTTATTNMRILQQKIKAEKKLGGARNLSLTEAEGAKFWLVCDTYQKDLQQINDRLAAASLAYADAYDKGPVTNETATKLLDEYLAIDDAEAKLKSTTTPKIPAVLPAVKAARNIQIENKIRAAAPYELAAAIPLFE
jgi:hypothetical protein